MFRDPIPPPKGDPPNPREFGALVPGGEAMEQPDSLGDFHCSWTDSYQTHFQNGGSRVENSNFTLTEDSVSYTFSETTYPNPPVGRGIPLPDSYEEIRKHTSKTTTVSARKIEGGRYQISAHATTSEDVEAYCGPRRDTGGPYGFGLPPPPGGPHGRFGFPDKIGLGPPFPIGFEGPIPAPSVVGTETDLLWCETPGEDGGVCIWVRLAGAPLMPWCPTSKPKARTGAQMPEQVARMIYSVPCCAPGPGSFGGGPPPTVPM